MTSIVQSRTIVAAVAVAAGVCVLARMPARAADEHQNRHYTVSRPPLKQTRFVHLPLGAVKPRGWLRNQLQAQADGLTSYVYSAFSAPSNDGNPPYHQEGIVALAYTLGDERVKALAEGYVDRRVTQPISHRVVNLANASIMRFLIEYQEATGDARIVPWMRDWYQQVDWSKKAGGWEGAVRNEHLVAMYWLYNRTGDKLLLERVERELGGSDGGRGHYTITGVGRVAEGFLAFPEKKTDTHGVITALRIKYPGLYYLQTGEDEHRRASLEGIDRLDKCFGLVGGRFAAHENFPRLESGREPNNATELCCVAEYAYSMEALFEALGDLSLADRLESLIYNSVPGSMTGDLWGHQYDTQANQVLVTAVKRHFDNDANGILYGPLPMWQCCLCNMNQSWPRFVKSMWMASHDNGLVAAAYGPCEVTARVGAEGREVTVVEDTEYPFDGAIRLNLQLRDPTEFPLHLRIPAWAEGATIRAQGEETAAKPGAIATIKRVWRNGDSLELRLPMKVRIENRCHDAASILRGPLYFALRIGADYREFPKERGRGIREKTNFPVFDWEIYPTTPWNYALVIDRADPGKSVEVRTQPAGKLPFAHKGEPIVEKVPSGDAAADAKATFKVEVSRVLPHPAEHDLADGKTPWTLTKDGSKQWVCFERRIWQQDEPVILKAKGRLIPGWKMLTNKTGVPTSVEPAPQSPVPTREPVVEIELVPYGCTRLRLVEFPVATTSP
ncbi:MAG: beta-L-arabinofuranosidase domain-containing protein [Thermoguttaceae bacterium]